MLRGRGRSLYLCITVQCRAGRGGDVPGGDVELGQGLRDPQLVRGRLYVDILYLKHIVLIAKDL